jgi:hypothetical protein
MADTQTRRSCRVAMSLPIRVFGVDFRGIDFTEEALTVVVNLHGAKIRLAHQLLPDAEIRVVNHSTGRDEIFRVVSKLQSSEAMFTYWGVESLDAKRNIWGVEIPQLLPMDQLNHRRITLQCPSCSGLKSLRVDKPLLASLQEKGGVERTCKVCNTHGLWKLMPYDEE